MYYDVNARNLKKLRSNQGLTQEALGELVGCTGRTISRIENNDHQPQLALAYAICEALHSDFKAVFDFEKIN